MALISLQDAAQRIGATEDLIRQWIGKGLLKPRLVLGNQSGSNSMFCFLTPAEVVRVDEEELHEVAEMFGWLLLSAYSLDEGDTPPDSSA